MNSSIKKNEIAIAISVNELARFYLASHVLTTHTKLNSDDIVYAANYICTICNDKFEQFLQILTYIWQDKLCKFALTFNKELDTAIKRRDASSLKKILTGPKEMFVELYDNIFLTDEQKFYLIRQLSKERFAIHNTFEILKDDTLHNKNIGQILNKSYELSNTQDAKLGDSPLLKYDFSRKSIYIIEDYMFAKIAYCYGIIDLSLILLEDNQSKFQNVDKLKDDYKLEIALVKRYKQTI